MRPMSQAISNFCLPVFVHQESVNSPIKGIQFHFVGTQQHSPRQYRYIKILGTLLLYCTPCQHKTSSTLHKLAVLNYTNQRYSITQTSGAQLHKLSITHTIALLKYRNQRYLITHTSGSQLHKLLLYSITQTSSTQLHKLAVLNYTNYSDTQLHKLAVLNYTNQRYSISQTSGTQ